MCEKSKSTTFSYYEKLPPYIILTLATLPSTQAGKALASAGGALGGTGAVAAGAAGAGLVTAGVAK